MKDLIIDNANLKYQVVDSKGKMLTEAHSMIAAQRFLDSLPLEERKVASIRPVAGDGKQVLLS